MLTTSIVNEREWCTELSTCSFQFSPKTRQTMPLYAYLTPKVDTKRKFNHHQSFLYEWRLTARTIRKFRIGPSLRIESRIGRTIRNRIESRSFAGPYSTRRKCRVVTRRVATRQVEFGLIPACPSSLIVLLRRRRDNFLSYPSTFL